MCAHFSQLIWQRLSFFKREKKIVSSLVRSAYIYSLSPDLAQQRFPNQNANHMLNGKKSFRCGKGEEKRKRKNNTNPTEFHNLDHRRDFSINTDTRTWRNIQRWFVKNCSYFSFNWNPVLFAPINYISFIHYISLFFLWFVLSFSFVFILLLPWSGMKSFIQYSYTISDSPSA